MYATDTLITQCLPYRLLQCLQSDAGSVLYVPWDDLYIPTPPNRLYHLPKHDCLYSSLSLIGIFHRWHSLSDTCFPTTSDCLPSFRMQVQAISYFGPSPVYAPEPFQTGSFLHSGLQAHSSPSPSIVFLFLVPDSFFSDYMHYTRWQIHWHVQLL